MAKKKPSPSSRDLIVGIVAQVYAVDSATLRDDTVISRLSKRTDLESLDRWTLMGKLEATFSLQAKLTDINRMNPFRLQDVVALVTKVQAEA